MTDRNAKSTKISARVKNDLHDWATNYAESLGISLSAVLNIALAKLIKLKSK